MQYSDMWPNDNINNGNCSMGLPSSRAQRRNQMQGELHRSREMPFTTLLLKLQQCMARSPDCYLPYIHAMIINKRIYVLSPERHTNIRMEVMGAGDEYV
jgi:hypothetical protein